MIIDALKEIQLQHGYLPAEALQELSRRLNIPLYRLHGVASFYPHFRLQPPPPLEVKVCTDFACRLRGADAMPDRARAALQGLPFADAPITPVSCLGRCDGAPAMAINAGYYTHLDPAGMRDIFTRLAQRRPLEHTPLQPLNERYICNPYNGPSTYDALRHVQHDGDAQRVLDTLKQSGLRGMGGAGFPTGTKWELVRQASSTVKYVVCNADESEPGTFKDREILTALPDLVLEGMAIAALVVGARKAIVYMRHEYEQEREQLAATLRQRQAQGLFGDLEFTIFESPGGYICGEETALLEALEDKRAEPRNKPPFPGTHGLFQTPTLINNVETFAMVPGILLNGGEWWAAQGCNGAQGLKLLAVSGHVNAPGVYEVPMGIRAAELIERAGGVLDGRPLKAFAPGGASSGFLPAQMADTPLDFRSLAAAGSMLGSGAVVVVAEGTCMLDLALNVSRFFRNESCGKCVPCRVGSEKIVALLENLHAGHGSEADLTLIDELASTMMLTSICGLGQAAPNPVLSVIKYFRDDIMRYIRPQGLHP